MKRIGNEGFTLIESLLVLCCVSVFFMVPMILLKKWQEEMEIAMFFNQLERNIEKTQQSAIVEAANTSINQKDLENVLIFNYVHHGNMHQNRLEVNGPLNLRTSGSIDFLTTTGNIKEIKQIKIEDHLHKKVVRYQFQLGSGKVIRSEGKL
ncbi:type II secretion system protein [Vagococcus sp. DIV0080]|uniref:Type II secretion system protein n=1 Tax=Candidatus Vagococcus giribetii TaxID=2230876 RepID=A0ABS3HRX4_9ENTE|nr:competence type IV pilus minor pilin ComGD [Vagococcus sp. DIV0080]MBO0476518.1 type II secretion system protein [Vagococcus sp. DIV0080]